MIDIECPCGEVIPVRDYIDVPGEVYCRRCRATLRVDGNGDVEYAVVKARGVKATEHTDTDGEVLDASEVRCEVPALAAKYSRRCRVSCSWDDDQQLIRIRLEHPSGVYGQVLYSMGFLRLSKAPLNVHLERDIPRMAERVEGGAIRTAPGRWGEFHRFYAREMYRITLDGGPRAGHEIEISAAWVYDGKMVVPVEESWLSTDVWAEKHDAPIMPVQRIARYYFGTGWDGDIRFFYIEGSGNRQ